MMGKKNQTPIFIVSTGRTGSTFIAEALNKHPNIAIILDIIEPLGPNPFFEKNKIATGSEFFKEISKPSIKPRLRYWKKKSTKERRFYPEDDNLVSLLLCYAIPFVTHDPMDFFYKIKKEFEKIPKQTMDKHTIKLFEMLRDEAKKDLWVEKTGGSIPQIEKIVDIWPTGKYIYSYRDGREVAISMHKHPMFRMYNQMLKNPDLDEWDFEYYPPIEDLGKMWNDWTVKAHRELKKIPDNMKMDLKYEYLSNYPEDFLISLLNFILDQEKETEFDKKWAKKWAKGVSMAPLRFETFNLDDQKKLEKTCKPGLIELGYDLKFS